MISVCIPTYNGEKYIKEQLASIIHQLSEEDEIIISDDSSTDNTLDLIEEINDNRITLLKNATFKSPIFNLENALIHAKGNYILFADQDDIWEPEKVKKMMGYLQDYDLVICNCAVIDDKNEILHESFFKLRNSGKGFLKNLRANTFLGCCMGIRRDVLEYALPFPKNIPMHDIWLGLITEVLGKTQFVDDKLVRYRRHGENASFGGEKSGYSLKYKIAYRFTVFYLVLKRAIKFKLRRFTL